MAGTFFSRFEKIKFPRSCDDSFPASVSCWRAHESVNSVIKAFQLRSVGYCLFSKIGETFSIEPRDLGERPVINHRKLLSLPEIITRDRSLFTAGNF